MFGCFRIGNADIHLYKTLIVRTSLPPSTLAKALRKAAAAVDPTQAPFDPLPSRT